MRECSSVCSGFFLYLASADVGNLNLIEFYVVGFVVLLFNLEVNAVGFGLVVYSG